jgi:hypothetical protein
VYAPTTTPASPQTIDAPHIPAIHAFSPYQQSPSYNPRTCREKYVLLLFPRRMIAADGLDAHCIIAEDIQPSTEKPP